MADGSTIRNLIVKAGFDLSNFEKGCVSMGRSLQTIGKNTSKAGSTLTKDLTMPIIAAISGLTAFTVSTAKSADELNDLSVKTGWSTDSLQKLQYEAKNVGYNFDNLESTLSRITKAIGAAQKSNQDYIKISDKVKVSIKDQTTGALKSNEQVLYDIVDALGSMTDETQRNVASQDIFGKSFEEINPLIQAGSSGLKALGEEAERTGAIISSQNVSVLNNLNDELDAMKQRLAAGSAQIAVAFAPVLKSLEPIITNTVLPALKGIANAISDVFKWFENASPTVQKFTMFAAGLAVAIGPLLTIVGGLIEGGGKMLFTLGKIKDAIDGEKGFLAILKAATGSTGLMVAAIVAAVAVIGTLIIALNNTDPEIQKLKQDADDLKNSTDDMEKTYKDSITSINANAAAAQTLSDKLYDLDTKTNKTNADKEEEKQLVDQLNNIYPDLNLSIDQNTGRVTKNKEAIDAQIKSLKNQAIATANASLFSEASKNESEALLKQQDAYTALQEAQTAYDNAIGKPTFGWDLSKLKHNLDTAQAAYDESTEAYNNDVADRKYAENQLDDSTKKVANDKINANNSITQSDSDAAAARKTMLDMITTAEKDYMDQAAATTAADIKKQNGMKATEKEMARETKLLNTYTASMQKLGGKDNGMSEGALKYLQSLGLSGAKLANQLANGTDADRKKFSDTYANLAQAGFDAGINELGSDANYNAAVTASQTTGKGAAQGIANGIKSNIGTITASLTTVLKAVAAGLKKVPLGVKVIYSTSWTDPNIIPNFGAKGGIKYHAVGAIATAPTWLDSANVIGEAGAEAILPLDRNTGWMDKIADKVVDKIGGLNVNITNKNYTQLDGRIAAVSTTKQNKIISLVKGVVTT